MDLAVGLFGFTSTALRVYAILLDVDFRSSGDRFNVLRMQILTQRARLQTVASSWDTLPPPFDPYIEGLVKQCVESIRNELDKLEKFESKYGLLQMGPSSSATPRKPSYTQRMKLELGEMDRLKESLTNITHLVDSLEVLTPRLVHDASGMDAISRPRGKNSKQKVSTTGPPSDHGLPKKREVESQKANQLFRSLVSVCEQTLRLISSSSEYLKEIFLSYRLWTHTLQTENIFALFTKSPSEISNRQGSDLLKVQYQILAHLAWTLSQTNEVFGLKFLPSGPDTLGTLHVVLNQVHDAGIHEDYFDPSDFEEIHKDANVFQKFATEELEILVDSLLNTLPSLLHKAQSRQMQPVPRVRVAVPHSLELEKEQPSSTKELLEISIQLTEEISDAFNEMSDETTPGKIPVEQSLRDLYNKEVAALQKWKEENGPKLSGKLTPQNKSVWEALEVTVFNMTDLLNNMSGLAKSTKATDQTLNSKADKLLAEYARMNPQLELSVELSQDQDFNAVIRSFGECVQSLVKMEAPLGLIEPPPVYEEKVGNKFVLNLEGQVLQQL